MTVSAAWQQVRKLARMRRGLSIAPVTQHPKDLEQDQLHQVQGEGKHQTKEHLRFPYQVLI